MTALPPEPTQPFEFAQPTEQFSLAPPSPKGRRVALIITLAIGLGLPLLIGVGVAAFFFISSALTPPAPPQLTASQVDRIEQEVNERGDLLIELDSQRDAYRTALSNWDQSVSWAEEAHGAFDQPTVAVANPGGDAMPGGDPYGRAFLDSIGATDVTVVFDAGPDNCGYYGNGGGYGYVYAGGCFRGDYANTLYMAWDPGAEDIVWAIFVHEAMHWFQAETYVQDTYLADFAGVTRDAYNERWEADASCRAVYVYGMSLADYEGSSSPCTIDGWYEGFIADYLTSLGANLAQPDPATYELAESSRP